jgi:hypothetical protein
VASVVLCCFWIALSAQHKLSAKLAALDSSAEGDRQRCSSEHGALEASLEVCAPCRQ